MVHVLGKNSVRAMMCGLVMMLGGMASCSAMDTEREEKETKVKFSKKKAASVAIAAKDLATAMNNKVDETAKKYNISRKGVFAGVTLSSLATYFVWSNVVRPCLVSMSSGASFEFVNEAFVMPGIKEALGKETWQKYFGEVTKEYFVKGLLSGITSVGLPRLGAWVGVKPLAVVVPSVAVGQVAYVSTQDPVFGPFTAYYMSKIPILGRIAHVPQGEQQPPVLDDKMWKPALSYCAGWVVGAALGAVAFWRK